MGHRSGIGIAVVVAALSAAGAARAATITVTNGNDSGPGSLRAAVAAASPGDTITIPALPVDLTSGQILISQSLTLTGAGARLTTINGDGSSRVFDITGGLVTISGVTIKGGDGFDVPGGTAGNGGGIVTSHAGVTVRDSMIVGNTVPAGLAGAGIYAVGGLDVVRSTIAGNAGLTSLRGGGIAFRNAAPTDTFQLSDSTVTNNTLASGGLGAGVYVFQGGAGVSLAGDTIAANSAGPAGSALDMNSDASPTSVTDTVVIGGASQSCSRMPSTSPSLGGNLEDQALCEFTQPTDFRNTSVSLGPLQDNGGPTDTMLPAPSSLLVDTGLDSTCLLVDQRGVPRPQGGACDIGAVERTTPTANTPSVSAVTTTSAQVSATVNPVFIGGSSAFHYGTTVAYGMSTAPAQMHEGVAAQPVIGTLSNLRPGTTYHVDVVLTTPDGTASSSDLTFTTQPSSPGNPGSHGHVVLSALRVVPSTASLSGRRVHGRCLASTRGRRARPHCRRRITLQVRYRLDAPDAVAFTLERRVVGRRVHGRCVRPTGANELNGRCTLLVRVPGKIVITGVAGANRFVFTGRVGGHSLGAGTYQLTATPTGGPPRTVIFRILP